MSVCRIWNPTKKGANRRLFKPTEKGRQASIWGLIKRSEKNQKGETFVLFIFFIYLFIYLFVVCVCVEGTLLGWF